MASKYLQKSLEIKSKSFVFLSWDGISKSTVLTAIEVLFLAPGVCWDEARWTAVILLPLLLITVMCVPPDSALSQ